MPQPVRPARVIPLMAKEFNAIDLADATSGNTAINVYTDRWKKSNIGLDWDDKTPALRDIEGVIARSVEAVRRKAAPLLGKDPGQWSPKERDQWEKTLAVAVFEESEKIRAFPAGFTGKTEVELDKPPERYDLLYQILRAEPGKIAGGQVKEVKRAKRLNDLNAHSQYDCEFMTAVKGVCIQKAEQIVLGKDAKHYYYVSGVNATGIGRIPDQRPWERGGHNFLLSEKGNVVKATAHADGSLFRTPIDPDYSARKYIAGFPLVVTNDKTSNLYTYNNDHFDATPAMRQEAARRLAILGEGALAGVTPQQIDALAQRRQPFSRPDQYRTETEYRDVKSLYLHNLEAARTSELQRLHQAQGYVLHQPEDFQNDRKEQVYVVAKALLLENLLASPKERALLARTDLEDLFARKEKGPLNAAENALYATAHDFIFQSGRPQMHALRAAQDAVDHAMKDGTLSARDWKTIQAVDQQQTRLQIDKDDQGIHVKLDVKYTADFTSDVTLDYDLAHKKWLPPKLLSPGPKMREK